LFKTARRKKGIKGIEGIDGKDGIVEWWNNGKSGRVKKSKSRRV
jgi:hypothetical protein